MKSSSQEPLDQFQPNFLDEMDSRFYKYGAFSYEKGDDWVFFPLNNQCYDIIIALGNVFIDLNWFVR